MSLGSSTLGSKPLGAKKFNAGAVIGIGNAVYSYSADGVGVHGVIAVGVGDAHYSYSAFADARHGESGQGSIVYQYGAQAIGIVVRYELRGEVRDNGILINRRVRAYRRDSGELIGDVDTVSGKFIIHAGFEEHEHYLTPVDLNDAATDFLPPTANRVISFLAQDNP